MNARVDAVAEVAETPTHQRVLVIKLGALGDFVQALGPMQAVREHHKQAEITLLTTQPFAELAKQSGYFDTVLVDKRPSWYQAGGWIDLVGRLRRGRFDRVYDLQTSNRSGRYWRLMGRPEWSGNVPGCSHPDRNPDRDSLHTIDRQRGQLHDAGIAGVPLTDLSWVKADADQFGLKQPYVLMAAGGSAHRPGKRWPMEKYAALARRLLRRNIEPVLLGAAAEEDLIGPARGTGVGIRNLIGRTSFQDIVALARGAAGAVGNDTGPMHLIAMAGCHSVVLFSGESNPALCAPRPGAQGGSVRVIQRDVMRGISIEEVEGALNVSDSD